MTMDVTETQSVQMGKELRQKLPDLQVMPADREEEAKMNLW